MSSFENNITYQANRQPIIPSFENDITYQANRQPTMPSFENDIKPSSDAPSTGATVQENAIAAKDAAINGAAAAINNVKNSQIAQDLANGPAAQSVKNQAQATSNEFSSLSDSRTTPSHTAANNTSLTHYHSFFYTLLSWKHPRATAITYGSSVIFIFACRYLPVVSWLLRLSYMILGVVTLAEVAAKFVMGSSVASSVRPRRYYKIPKESLEASMDDLEQFINFFVIEIQRIVFAENTIITGAAFSAAFLSYYLIKVLPFWGMSLLAISCVFLGPLVYVSNKELIDSQLEHASNVVSQQATQVKDLASEQTSKGLESVKAYTGDYAAKASEFMGKSRQKIAMPGTNGSSPAVNEGDFPTAPRTNLPASSAEHTKPIVYAPVDGAPIAVSSA